MSGLSDFVSKKIVPKAKSVTKNVGRSLSGKNTYISDAKEDGRFGSTYRKIGPISVLKSGATPETKRKALAQQKAKGIR